MNCPVYYRSGKYDIPKTFAVKHKDERVRMASRSGGIFTALSDKVLKEEGVVYGCIMIDCSKAVHIRAESESERNKMRGSKYIQSDLGDVFKRVRIDLNKGRLVLFSGTSCQVSGLKGYLRKQYDNLLLVDIVCHGVPSPIVWQKYLNWQEKRNNSKIIRVDFRNKEDFGWTDHVESLYLENGKQVNSRVFKNLFYGHAVLRPSCYSCPYKDIIHPGDITIADYWGIEKAAPIFDDNKGTSLVLINNDKGQEWFEAIRKSLDTVETRIEDSMQPPLNAPFPQPSNREEFWRDIKDKDFDYVVNKYGKIAVSILIKRKAKKLLRI